MRCAKGSSALLPWLADTLDGGLVVVRVLVLGLGPLDLFCPASPLAGRWSRCPAGKILCSPISEAGTRRIPVRPRDPQGLSPRRPEEGQGTR